MSVGILIQYRDGRADSYHPVVGESAFHGTWRPLMRGQAYPWLEQLSTGFPVGPEDLGEVLQELDLLIAKAESVARYEFGEDRLERMYRCREVLQGIDWQEVEELFLG